MLHAPYAGLRMAGSAGLGKRANGGPVDHRSVGLELRAVARAIPAFLKSVPVDDATDVGAHRRALDHSPVVLAIRRDLRRTAADDRALAGLQFFDRSNIAAGQIFGQIGNVLGAAGDEVGEAGAGDRFARGVEELGEMRLLPE